MRLVLALLLVFNLTAATRKGHRPLIRMPLWCDAPDFKLADIQVNLDGKPLPVNAAKGPQEDLMILVVFDVVGDVALVNPARESLISAIEKSPPSVFVGLLRAQDDLRVLQDPTADHTVLAEAIRALPLSGRPGLLGTVEQAAQLADSLITKTSVRLAVMYITDSDIYEYREDYTNPVINSSDSRDLSRRFPEGLIREKISKLETTIAALDAPLFIAHLAYSRDRLNEAYQTGLLQLAQVTGGTAVFCRTLAEIPTAVEGIYQRILNHWAFDLKLPQRRLKNIQVQVEGCPGVSYRSRFLIKEK